MAKFNSAIGPIRGSIGSLTFSHGRSGDIIKRKTSPVQPQTPKQTVTRERMTGLSKSFSNDLSQVQRDAWDALADAHPETDVFGNPITITGQNLFIRLNTNLQQNAETAISDAPANLNVTTLLTVSLVTASGDSALVTSFTPSPIAANERLVIWSVQNLSPGKTYVDNLFKWMDVFPGLQASPANPDVGILCIAGQRQWVRASVLNIDNGAKSPGIVANQITPP